MCQRQIVASFSMFASWFASSHTVPFALSFLSYPLFIMAEPDFATYMSNHFTINTELRQQITLQGLRTWTSIKNTSESDITDAASARHHS